MAKKYYIGAGPDTFDLMLSLFDRKRSKFTLQENPFRTFSIEVSINAAEYVPTSGGWILKGLITKIPARFKNRKGRAFKATYCVHINGHIKGAIEY